jgi:hypothetical protein
LVKSFLRNSPLPPAAEKLYQLGVGREEGDRRVERGFSRKGNLFVKLEIEKIFLEIWKGERDPF